MEVMPWGLPEESEPLADGPVVIRKYYAPLASGKIVGQLSNARALHAKIFSLSNAPEMRLVSGEQIAKQVARMIESSKVLSVNGPA